MSLNNNNSNNNTEAMLITTTLPNEDEMETEMIEKPLSVRDRIRLMNLDASSSQSQSQPLSQSTTPTPTSTPGRNKLNPNAVSPAAFVPSSQQQQQQQTSMSKNKFFPPTPSNSRMTSYDDTSFPSSSISNIRERYNNKRCDIVSDPGVSSSSHNNDEATSAAAAITKWRRRRNEDLNSGDGHELQLGAGAGANGNVNSNVNAVDAGMIQNQNGNTSGGGTGEDYSKGFEQYERTEWTISDLTRSSSNRKKKKNHLSNNIATTATIAASSATHTTTTNMALGSGGSGGVGGTLSSLSSSSLLSLNNNNNQGIGTTTTTNGIEDGSTMVEKEGKSIDSTTSLSSPPEDQTEVEKEEGNNNNNNCSNHNNNNTTNANHTNHDGENDKQYEDHHQHHKATITPTFANTKLKAVPSFVPRQLHQHQGDSSTFVIPKLRPVRKAPHTLAIIMKQKPSSSSSSSSSSNASTSPRSRSLRLMDSSDDNVKNDHCDIENEVSNTKIDDHDDGGKDKNDNVDENDVATGDENVNDKNDNESNDPTNNKKDIDNDTNEKNTKVESSLSPSLSSTTATTATALLSQSKKIEEHAKDVKDGTNHSSSPSPPLLRKSRLPFRNKQNTLPSTFCKPKGQIAAIGESSGSTTSTIDKSVNKNHNNHKDHQSDTDNQNKASSKVERTEPIPMSKKKLGTPQRSKVSDRIKAFSSVYSGSNTSKPKPSVPTPPKRMKIKRSLIKGGAAAGGVVGVGTSNQEEDVSLGDSSEKVTVQTYDDDSISVLTPMGNTGTPARLGAHPPTPNSYNSEAAYTAASSGDGAVAGSISSTQKQQLQMRYAKFDTPDVSQDGGSTTSASYFIEEIQKMSAIKNSLQSKLEYDKKKAVRMRIAPNHMKVPSILVAAQKKAQDLKQHQCWGENAVVENDDSITSLDKDVVKQDLKNMFDCENSIVSKHKDLYDNNDKNTKQNTSGQQEENQGVIETVDKESKSNDDSELAKGFHKKKMKFSKSSPKAMQNSAVQTRVTKVKSPLIQSKINFLLADNNMFPADEEECDSKKLEQVSNRKPVDTSQVLQTKQLSVRSHDDNKKRYTQKTESETSTHQLKENEISVDSTRVEQKSQSGDSCDLKAIGAQSEDSLMESITLRPTKTQKAQTSGNVNTQAENADSKAKGTQNKSCLMESITLRPTKMQKPHFSDKGDSVGFKAVGAHNKSSMMETITLRPTKISKSHTGDKVDDSASAVLKATEMHKKGSLIETVKLQPSTIQKPHPINSVDSVDNLDSKPTIEQNKESLVEPMSLRLSKMEKSHTADNVESVGLKVVGIGNASLFIESTSTNTQKPHAGESADAVDSKIVASQNKKSSSVESSPAESSPADSVDVQTKFQDPHLIASTDRIESIDLRAVGTQNKESPQVESNVIQTKVQDPLSIESVDSAELKLAREVKKDYVVKSEATQTKAKDLRSSDSSVGLKAVGVQKKNSPKQSALIPVNEHEKHVESNNQALVLEIPNASSSESQPSLSSQNSRSGDKKSLTKADAVKEMIKRRRRRRGNAIVKEEIIPKKENFKSQVIKEISPPKIKSAKVLPEKPQIRIQTKAAEGNGFYKKEKSRSIQLKMISREKKLMAKKKENNQTKKKENDQAKITQSNGFGSKEKIRSTQSKVLTREGNESRAYSSSAEATSSEPLNKEKAKVTKSIVQQISAIGSKTNSKLSEKGPKKMDKQEEQDSSGFIPMKTNAAKDRRTRFMKATNMKRKAQSHNRSLQLQKLNETNKDPKKMPAPAQKQTLIPSSNSKVADDLPALPPNIIRSITDDKYLESVIEQKPSNPCGEKSVKGKNMSWSLDSSTNDSRVKADDDEPEPVIESFINPDLSPIKSVDQSKHVYEASSPYYGSPDVYKVNNDLKGATPPRLPVSFEVQRQSTPRRRNRKQLSSKINEQHIEPQNLSINDSDSLSMASHALSAPICSTLEKKQQTSKEVPNLLPVQHNRSIDEHIIKETLYAEKSIKSKTSAWLKSFDSESEASSSFRSTSSGGKWSSRVNRALTTRRQKMNRIMQQQQQTRQYQCESNSDAILAKNLALQMLGEKQLVRSPIHEKSSSEVNKDQHKNSELSNDGMSHQNQIEVANKAYVDAKDTLDESLEKSSNNTTVNIEESQDTLNDEDKLEDDQVKDISSEGSDYNHSNVMPQDEVASIYSSDSCGSGYLDITDGQISVDANELVDDKEENEDKENIQTIGSTISSSIHYNDCTETTIKTKTGGQMTSNSIDNTVNESQETQMATRNTWFSENISNLAHGIVTQCDGGDLSTNGLSDGMNYCGSGVNVNVTSGSMNLSTSTMSAVRISQDGVPSDEDQEGIEVEYLESISANIGGGPTDSSILMHFNSQIAGSIPLKSNESLFGISNDKSSEFNLSR